MPPLIALQCNKKQTEFDCRSCSPFASSSSHLVFDGLLVDGLGCVAHYACLLLVPQPFAVLDVTLDIRIRRCLAVRVHNVACADQLGREIQNMINKDSRNRIASGEYNYHMDNSMIKVGI